MSGNQLARLVIALVFSTVCTSVSAASDAIAQEQRDAGVWASLSAGLAYSTPGIPYRHIALGFPVWIGGRHSIGPVFSYFGDPEDQENHFVVGLAASRILNGYRFAPYVGGTGLLDLNMGPFSPKIVIGSGFHVEFGGTYALHRRHAVKAGLHAGYLSKIWFAGPTVSIQSAL